MIKEKIKIKFQAFPKPNDKTDTNYRIFKCSPINSNTELKLDNNFMFAIKGDLSYLDIDNEYEVSLEEIETNKWGTTYKIKELFNLQNFENLSREESEQILNGIASKNNIKTLLDVYPDFINKILIEGLENIDKNKLYNIKDAKLNSYYRQITAKYKYVSVINSLKDYDISISDAKILCETYKAIETIENEIKLNPYHVLIDILKRPFLSERYDGTIYGVDIMLVKSEKPLREDLKDSDIRCEYMMLHVLDLNENGNKDFKGGSTKLNGKKIYKYCKDYAPELCAKMRDVAVECDGIYIDEKTNDMAKMSTYMKEVRIRDFIKMLLENNSVLDWNWKQFTKIKDGELTEEQQGLLKAFCEHRLIILDALGGGGKTSATSALLDMIEHYGGTYKCLSPTGKASKRFTEQTNRSCSTIHLCKLKEGGTTAKYVIVDEDSFLSVDLMTMVIDCILNKDEVRLVLVGDIFQIPSIGAGRVIGNMINSNKIPVVTLTKNFRFGDGGKSMVSTKCRYGEFYIKDEDLNKDIVTYGKNKDYTYIRATNDINQIVDVYENILNKYKCKPKDIWVLSSWNVKEFGSNNINSHIQALVNEPKPNEKIMAFNFTNNHVVFKKNDIVMNTKNNYCCLTEDIYNELENDPDLNKEDFGNQLSSCFNGEVGHILEVKDNVLKIQFDEQILVFNKDDAKNLLLGYSINFFKAQGSSNKYIIVLTVAEHKRSLNRNMLYTALSRATDVLIEIGDIQTMKNAVNTLGDYDRETFLTDLLEEI